MALQPNIALQVQSPKFIDPLEAYAKAAQVKNLLVNTQLQQQLRSEEIQKQQLANQQAQLNAKDDEISRRAFLDAAGDPDKTATLAAQNGASPQRVQNIQKHFADITKTKVEAGQKQNEIEKFNNEQRGGLIQQYSSLPDDQARAAAYPRFRDEFHRLDPTASLPDEPLTGDALTVLNFGHATEKALNDRAEAQIKQNQEKRTAEEQPFKLSEAQSKATKAALDNAAVTIGSVNDQPGYLAWAAKQPAAVKELIPAQYSPDAVASIKRMGVPAEKQPEFDINTYKSRMGLIGNSEYDQFLAQYARSLGKTPAQLSPQEGLNSFSQFAEIKQDPVLRGAALAQKNLAITLQKLQLDQAPTKEDAAMIADDIVNHRMAPDQISQIRGRGNGGLGIMVEREIKKVDPKFNWEQASSEYGLTKSSGFQQNIRYMDSVQESIPLVIDRARKLANGNVRSINALINAGKNQFNDVDVKRFETDRALVADEIAKILQGGGTGSGTSDMKLKQAGEILKSTDSPASIAAALGDVNELIGFRRKALTRGTYLDGTSAREPAAAAGAASPGLDLSKFEVKK